MSQVISTQLFSWAVYGVSLFLICLVFINRLPLLSRLCMQGVMGASFIMIINCILFRLNLCLGINAVTVFISSVMGIPGIGLMYLLLYIF